MIGTESTAPMSASLTEHSAVAVTPDADRPTMGLERIVDRNGRRTQEARKKHEDRRA